jgi:SAM-dependent methyltransferase
MEFELQWEGPAARHIERYFAPKVNFWRDVFPPGLKKDLGQCGPGDAAERRYEPGDALFEYEESEIKTVRASEFRQPAIQGRRIEPKLGRFYPRGLAPSLPGVFPSDLRPCRIVRMDENNLTLDLNHPLARYPFTLRAKVLDLRSKDCEVGGRLTEWIEALADNGPGMQAPAPGLTTDFSSLDASKRLDEAEDSLFYADPRLVGHIDAQADALLTKACAEALSPLGAKPRILDLMASAQSHLPLDLDAEVVGLGLNRAELDANPRLSERLLQDLNQTPRLPFPDQSFDAALCSLSIEYLLDPQQAVRELGRVLKPGGACLLSFSNRWFPTKATSLWIDLHEFERMGLVLRWLHDAQGFADFRTLSLRNWPRPYDDPHYKQIRTSDPVYLVSARKV